MAVEREAGEEAKKVLRERVQGEQTEVLAGDVAGELHGEEVLEEGPVDEGHLIAVSHQASGSPDRGEKLSHRRQADTFEALFVFLEQVEQVVLRKLDLDPAATRQVAPIEARGDIEEGIADKAHLVGTEPLPRQGVEGAVVQGTERRDGRRARIVEGDDGKERQQERRLGEAERSVALQEAFETIDRGFSVLLPHAAAASELRKEPPTRGRIGRSDGEARNLVEAFESLDAGDLVAAAGDERCRLPAVGDAQQEVADRLHDVGLVVVGHLVEVVEEKDDRLAVGYRQVVPQGDGFEVGMAGLDRRAGQP